MPSHSRAFSLAIVKLQKAYKVLDANTERVHINRDVHFFENKGWDLVKAVDSTATNFAPPNDVEGDLDNYQMESSLPSDSRDEQLEIVQDLNDSSIGNSMSMTGDNETSVKVHRSN